jgi:hypothetical protein
MLLVVKLILMITFFITMVALNIFFKLKEDSFLNFYIKRICRDFLIAVLLLCLILILLFTNGTEYI